MARYEDASVKSYTSLAVLNAGQAMIFTIGLTAAMVMCVYGIRNGTNTVGDFVMINAMMIQLYQPLNFMGMVYREIKQAVIDIETMFLISAREPEIEDKPGAKPLVVSAGAHQLRERVVRLRAGAADPQGRELRGAGRPHGRDRRAFRRRQIDDLAAAVPLLRCRRRPHPDRRPGYPRGHADVAARGDRHGAAGHRAVQRHHPLQHPLRPLGRERRRGRGGGARSRRSTTSSARRRKATRPRSASAA